MDPDFVVTVAELMGKGALLLLEYLKVVAWPAVVVLLAFAYKDAIVDVLSRIQEASGFGGKIRMTQRIEHAARELNEQPVPELKTDANGTSTPSAAASADGENVSPSSSNSSPRKLRVYSVAMTGDVPSSTDQAQNYWTMMRAWGELEETAIRAGERLQLSPGPSRNLGFLGRQLLDRGLISVEAADLGARLQDLRNRMVHEVDKFLFTDWMADDFAQTAGKLVKIYEDVIERLDKSSGEDPV